MTETFLGYHRADGRVGLEESRQRCCADRGRDGATNVSGAATFAPASHGSERCTRDGYGTGP